MNGGKVKRPFYEKSFEKGKKELVLRDELLELKEGYHFDNLADEIEARWRLVESAWNLNLNPAVLEVAFDANDGLLHVKDREMQRKDLTSVRSGLIGYQKGKCFYSGLNISISPGSCDLAAVDHFMPHRNKRLHIAEGGNVNGVWNLVLADAKMNSKKGARIPEIRFLSRLFARNEFYIESRHPLGNTIINQTGKTPKARAAFLQKHFEIAYGASQHTWTPNIELDKTKLYL